LGSRTDRTTAVRTCDRLGRLILLIPWWEGQAADPEEKQGPAKDVKRQQSGKFESA